VLVKRLSQAGYFRPQAGQPAPPPHSEYEGVQVNSDCELGGFRNVGARGLDVRIACNEPFAQNAGQEDRS
jgi:hypothetical protein